MVKINYSCISLKGKIREENQDNFLCMDKILTDDECRISGTCNNGIFAVFDGIGGGSDGKKAAELSAVYMRENTDRIIKSPSESIDVFNEMNDIVCEYAQKNKYAVCGTTVVSAIITEDTAYISNVGDSRAYYYSSGLYQLSSDHITRMSGRKGLTQYIGIPKEDLLIEPYFGSIKFRCGDKLLLCSDGLTDMVDDNYISSCLSMKNDVGEICRRLADEAMNRGGRDNITLIVLERGL